MSQLDRRDHVLGTTSSEEDQRREEFPRRGVYGACRGDVDERVGQYDERDGCTWIGFDHDEFVAGVIAVDAGEHRGQGLAEPRHARHGESVVARSG